MKMMIKLLPIDYCGTIDELSKWHDEWSCEVFGSIDPSRYYKQSGEGGRYLYGVAEDMSLNEEKATRERVLELLLRIRSINQKLRGMSISQHLQYEEREQMKMERKTLYDEYLELVQPEPQQDFNPEPQQEISKPTRMRGRPKKPFKNMMMDDADGSKLQKVKTIMHGKDGKEAALIIKACVQKGWMCKPTYKQVKDEFGDIGCRSGFNKYMSGNLTKEEIDGAINSLDLPK